ncbi:MAG: DUF3990 domain-containing protein [Oscillospiraceae bacterium]|nr:DUF3990 domain-containing protein [Oscillospiraceae bacterium]
MSKTIVFHGSYAEIKKPVIKHGKRTKDFGDGFYCTVIKEQAEKWARRFDTPVVNSYSLLIDTNLDILEFKTMTDEWLDFIINCRSGVPHSHDIVIGAMANDQIYNYVSDYIDGVITREQFWALAKFKYPTHQINFCSEKALNCLTFIRSESAAYERKRR